MSDYDRRPGRAKTAGKSFKQHVERMQDALQKAHFETRGAEGLLHYRLYGDGATKDHFSNEPFLDDQQKRQAEAARKDVLEVQKAIELALKKMDKFENQVRWLDDTMSFH